MSSLVTAAQEHSISTAGRSESHTTATFRGSHHLGFKHGPPGVQTGPLLMGNAHSFGNNFFLKLWLALFRVSRTSLLQSPRCPALDVWPLNTCSYWKAHSLFARPPLKFVFIEVCFSIFTTVTQIQILHIKVLHRGQFLWKCYTNSTLRLCGTPS